MASSIPFERPRMLKDFLVDDSPSCSSKDFKSFPRKSCKFTTTSLSSFDKMIQPNKSPSQLVRSRSKAASISISAVHKASDIVINAIKFFPFASIKYPSILPRSLSHKLSKRNKDGQKQVSVKMKVKDILRWKSFRDIVLEEMPTPLDFTCSSNQWCNTSGTITTGSSSTTASSSQRSSWYESDFTAEDSSSCCSECKDCMDDRETTSFKRQFQFDEDEQHSPVSVLDSPFRENAESLAFVHRSLGIMERRKCTLMQRIQDYECLAKLEPVMLEKEFHIKENSIFQDGEETNVAVDQRAKQLLSHLKATSSSKNLEPNAADCLLMDFFRQKLATREHQDPDFEFDSEILRLAESWMNGGCNKLSDWELLGHREACLRDMEKGLRWNKFEEEQQNIGCELELEVLNDLLDELLADFIQ